MTELEYTFKNDILFKMLFVQYPDLLKRLVAELLSIPYDSIEQFVITNPEMPPESLGDKFCRLDINMTVDGQRVDLEIQVRDEGDYPERSLYYWARDYSTALGSAHAYSELPRTVIINIIAFNMFDCEEFHSEFQALEVTRYTPLTDRMSLHYFELLKLPELANTYSGLELWLALFSAETEEDLKKIEELEEPIMEQAIVAYRHITSTNEFKEKERLYALARHNEASALAHARREERATADAEWQAVVAEKDTALAEKEAEIAKLREQLSNI
jgi:predicted transposase/invertase (TIGR01784 family)